MIITRPERGSIELYMEVLRAICGYTMGESMIDLGCCFAPNTPKLGFIGTRYVDIIYRELDDPQDQVDFHKADILNLPEYLKTDENNNKYNVALCLDCIEHLTVEDGNRLLKIMDEISHKQILFTPTTNLFGLNNDDTPEAHRSVWSPEMLPGYACIVFPDFHYAWGGGAFFAWRCADIENDFNRVKQILNYGL